jgi:hypothetical protein
MINTVGVSFAFVNAEVEYRRGRLASQWGSVPAGGRGLAASRFRLPRLGSHQPLPVSARGEQP